MNFFGGPGTGKSTMMANAFAELKWHGVNCEMAPEFAKDKVWEGSLNVLENQLYIFGKQSHRIHRLEGKVDVILTDSPLLLSLLYGKNCSPTFKALVREEYSKYNNMNFFLTRHKEYQTKGRLQTEKKAREMDGEIRAILRDGMYGFKEVEAKQSQVYTIALDIMMELKPI